MTPPLVDDGALNAFCDHGFCGPLGGDKDAGEVDADDLLEIL